MFKKVKVKKFDELAFKDKLAMLKEVMNLGGYGVGILLIKNHTMIDKNDLSLSKIFNRSTSFKEFFLYFKEILEILGLEEKTFEIWSCKIYYNGIPLANLDKNSITEKLLAEIIDILANQYATIWEKYLKYIDNNNDYDSVIYNNLMNFPLEDVDDFLFLKIHEDENKNNNRVF